MTSKHIEKILEKLKKYPNTKYVESDDSITIPPQTDTGFHVTFIDNGDNYIVHFDDWHQHFKDAEEALLCVGFGLSDVCQIKVISRGGFDYHWTVLSLHGGNWVEYSKVGLFLFPFWHAKSIRYLKNDLIKG